MTSWYTNSACLIGALLLLAPPTFGQTTYSYQTISYPGAVATYLTSVNSEGKAVGYIFTGTTEIGLEYADGKFRLVNLGPSDGLNSETILNGINDKGEVFGSYYNFSENTVKSYRIDPNGTVTLLLTSPFNSYSFHETTVMGVTNSGIAFGNASSGNLVGTFGVHGFIRQNGANQLLIDRKGFSTYLGGVNDAGEAVGLTYQTDGGDGSSDGFLYSNGTYTTIGYPGQSVTYFSGINDYDVIVGSFIPPGAAFQGFVYDHGSFSSIAVPGSIATKPLGINNRGVIVGFYDTPDYSNDCRFPRDAARVDAVPNFAEIAKSCSGAEAFLILRNARRDLLDP